MLLNLVEVPAKGKLDDYGANLYSAWGVDAMLGGYPWALAEYTPTNENYVSFRGSSINAELVVALSGSGNCALLNHNPSLTARYLGQSTQSRRPAISASSAYLGHVEFDASDDYLGTPSGVGGVSGVTVFFRGKLRSTTGSQMIFELTSNYNNADGFAFYWDSSISRLVAATNQSGVGRYAISEFNVSATTEAVFCIRYDRTQTSGANQCVLFVNGTKQTRTGSTGETGTVPSGNFATNSLYVGARSASTGSLFASLNLKSMAVYHTALSDSDCSTISGLL